MAFRQFLLRLMLISLGLAAVIGVAAMLFLDVEGIWRVVGTTITTGVGSGLMLLFSLLTGRQSSRNAGYLGMATTVIEFVLVLTVIWVPWSIGSSFNEHVMMTISAVLAGAVPAMASLRLAEQPGARVAGWTGVALGGAVCVMLLATIWALNSPEDEKLGFTALALGLIGPLAVISLVGQGRSPLLLQALGVFATLVAFLVAAFGIWMEIREGGSLTVACSIAAVLALANLLLLCPLKPGQNWLRYGTLAAAVSTAVFVDIIAYDPSGNEWDMLSRLAGASGIVAACGCLAMVILYRLNRKIEHGLVAAEIRQFTLVCPVCSTKQTLPAGDARCGKCGLGIRTRFEEPRCGHCGYLLYMLTSDRCPECGTPVEQEGVPASDDWRPPSL